MILLLLSLFFGFVNGATAPDKASRYSLPILRQEYLQASQDEKAAAYFYNKMADYNERHPVVIAYKGAAEAVMAKHSWSPYKKLKHIKSAADLFEEAVALDKTSTEIRFLRFIVEFYTPRYLNLSEHLQEDKRLIIEGLKRHPRSGLPSDLARTIKDFMLSKDHCTSAEKQVLRSIAVN